MKKKVHRMMTMIMAMTDMKVVVMMIRMMMMTMIKSLIWTSAHLAKKDATDNPSEGADSMFRVSQTDSLFAKGQAVTAQLSTWDKLLEQRILLQKMATKVNTF